MKVELIEYTHDGINLIARLARATRKNELEYIPPMTMKGFKDTAFEDFMVSDDYVNWFNNNKNFVKALLKVQHLGILEHITFTFHVSEISVVLTHQLVRHRMASYLQQSNRHVKPHPANYVIPQTIMDTDYPHKTYAHTCSHDIFIDCMNYTYDTYTTLIEQGIPIEDARYVLPPAFWTHITMTCNARQLYHLLELRLSKDAQAEIRELACHIFDIVHPIYPVLFEDLLPLREQNKEI